METVQTTLPIPGFDCTKGDNDIYTCIVEGEVKTQEEIQEIHDNINIIFSVIPFIFIISIIGLVFCVMRTKANLNKEKRKKCLYTTILMSIIVFILFILTLVVGYREMIAPWLYV